MNLSNKLFDFSWDTYDNAFHLSFKDRWNLFNIYFENPFRTWWKARKYFKIPKTSIKLICRKNTNSYTAKVLDIAISDLNWKDKWRTPRHEENPYINIILFKYFELRIEPKVYRIDEFGEKEESDLQYWEYLLDYLYYSKSLGYKSYWQTTSKIFQKVKKYGNSEDGDEKEPLYLPIYTHLFSLNKKGLKEFKKLYNK